MTKSNPQVDSKTRSKESLEFSYLLDTDILELIKDHGDMVIKLIIALCLLSIASSLSSLDNSIKKETNSYQSKHTTLIDLVG